MIRAVASIIIGNRHRKDMGDIAGLAASIKEVGLLHPPVVTPTGQLIAGERRLRAVQSLGWSEVLVRVIDVPALVRGELAENSFRKDFVPSEMVAIAAAVEQEEQAQARKRMIAAHASPAESAEQAKGETGKRSPLVSAPATTPLPKRNRSSQPPMPSRKSLASWSMPWTRPATSMARSSG